MDEGVGINSEVIQEYNEFMERRKYNHLFFEYSSCYRQIVLKTEVTLETPIFFLVDNLKIELMNLVGLPEEYHFGSLVVLLGDVLPTVLKHCTGFDLLLLASTCKSFWCTVMKPEVWQISTRYHLRGFLYDIMTNNSFRPAKSDYITSWKIYHKYLKIANKPIQTSESPKDYWNGLISSLPLQNCCYVVSRIQYDYMGTEQEKIVFILWSPEAALVRSKMLYSSSKATLRGSLKSIQKEFTLSDHDEGNYDVIKERCFL